MTCVTIWGNHSNTQYPDFTNAKINGKPATEVITDRAWLENTFVPQCQNRGAAVIKARGLSSALSAANGAIDHVKSCSGDADRRLGQRGGRVEGRVRRAGGAGVRLPLHERRNGNWKVVEGLKLDAFGQAKFEATLKELLEEKDAVKDLLPS